MSCHDDWERTALRQTPLTDKILVDPEDERRAIAGLRAEGLWPPKGKNSPVRRWTALWKCRTCGLTLWTVSAPSVRAEAPEPADAYVERVLIETVNRVHDL